MTVPDLPRAPTNPKSVQLRFIFSAIKETT